MLVDLNTKLLVLVTLSASCLRGSSAGSTYRRYRRQVPQEWAHAREVILVDKMLKLDNPLSIDHPIFSLLGPAAAAKGMGKLDKKNIDCFQKMVADQAFKNAKKAGDKKGQEAAIIFASIEKNTKSVGVASPPCKSKKMDSPEIERLIQHQDAASSGAAEINKKSALLAALSLKEINSDPTLAFNTGTFKAGDPKNPNNGAGGSCDDDKDTTGCIYTKKLLVEDVTKAEIDAFIKENAGAGAKSLKDSGSSVKDGILEDTEDDDEGGDTAGKKGKPGTTGGTTDSSSMISLLDESGTTTTGTAELASSTETGKDGKEKADKEAKEKAEKEAKEKTEKEAKEKPELKEAKDKEQKGDGMQSGEKKQELDKKQEDNSKKQKDGMMSEK